MVDKDGGEYGDDSVAALESLFAKVSKERQYAIALSDKNTMPLKELTTKAEYLEFITANNIMLPTWTGLCKMPAASATWSHQLGSSEVEGEGVQM